MKHQLYNMVTLNLNNICNLHCQWCYNQSTETSMMNFHEFIKFYHQILKYNVTRISLIGGEPTLHPQFADIVRVLNKQEIYLFTNGIKFSEKDFCKNVLDKTNLTNIMVSLKGFNERSFLNFTDTVPFFKFCMALDNLKKSKSIISISYNCTEKLKESMIEDMVHFLKFYHFREILLHDVRPYVVKSQQIIKNNTASSLQYMDNELEKRGIRTIIRPNQPFCYYDYEFILNHIKTKTLVSVCSVKTQQSIFIDTAFNVILCNGLSDIILGK